MPSKSYENLIFEREVSLAIQNIFVAPYGTSWTAARVTDVLAAPLGFYWLGAVVEDTPNMTVTREKFQLITGVPKVIQYQTVMQVAGRFECALYSNSPRKVQYALGNVEARNVMADTDPVTVTAGPHTRYTVTLSGSPDVAYNVGDYLAFHSNASTLAISQNEAQINSIGTAKEIYFGTPGLPNTPAGGDYGKKVSHVKLPLGTGLIRNYIMLGVADFIDGTQIIHKLNKVASAGEWSEQFRPDDVGKVPMAFDCYGVSNADYGSSQLIVGERFWFPA